MKCSMMHEGVVRSQLYALAGLGSLKPLAQLVHMVFVPPV